MSETVEYRVRPVSRFIVTRYRAGTHGNTGGSETKGEFDNSDTAYAVAYALAREEADRLGCGVGDERVRFPEPLPPMHPHPDAV